MRCLTVIIIIMIACLVGNTKASAQQPSDSAAASNQCFPISVLLRRDFNDIGWFCDSDRKIGALASSTYDDRAHRFGVSGDGVAALVFRYDPCYPPPGTSACEAGFAGLMLAPFVQFDGTHLFESLPTSKQNTDTVTKGAFTEFGFTYSSGAGNYFRLRLGEVQAQTGITTLTNTGIYTESFVGEWLVVYPGLFHDAIQVPRGVGPFEARIDPELMVQYDKLISGPMSYRLFSTNDYSMRVGPQISITIWLLDAGNIWKPWDDFWQKTFATILYHTAVDAYTNREYSWALGTITYNLSPNIGISLSYGQGNAEATGNTTSQFKLGLSGKF